MYPAIERGGIAFTTTCRQRSSGKIPYFLCEYDHSMGNASANMWSTGGIRGADNMLGGCIGLGDQSMKSSSPTEMELLR
jgi:hypothetical protein